jgi:two-component system chemotaxis response regulator CheY
MVKKILIVDDSPVARKILKSCFPKGPGFEIYEAGDGSEAVEMYQVVSPDITFMDLTMPVMDGIEALSRIKALNQNALVIVSTADVQKNTLDKIMQLGAFMLLKKPLNKESVQNAFVEVYKHMVKSG